MTPRLVDGELVGELPGGDDPLDRLADRRNSHLLQDLSLGVKEQRVHAPRRADVACNN